MLIHADLFTRLEVFSLAVRELLIDRKQLLWWWNDFCQTTL